MDRMSGNRVAGAAMLALAVAMGIGRFAFTPLLPMMQDGYAFTVADGAWLATANYAGYLAGALAALALPVSAPRREPAACSRSAYDVGMGYTHYIRCGLRCALVAGAGKRVGDDLRVGMVARTTRCARQSRIERADIRGRGYWASPAAGLASP